MSDRSAAAPEPGQIGNHQDVARLQVSQTGLPPRPCLRPARGMPYEDFDGPDTHQRVDLRVQGLAPGADPGVANHIPAQYSDDA